MPLDNIPRQRKAEPADFSDFENATAELERLTSELAGMIDQVADARTVIEYDSERRKNAFAKSVMKAFRAGVKGVSLAEYTARDSQDYAQDCDELKRDLATAERTRLKYETLRIRIDAIRTLISAQKATFNL